MSEKKLNYDANTLNISNLELRKNQDSGIGNPTGYRSGNESSGKVGTHQSGISHDLILRIIEKMKEA